MKVIKLLQYSAPFKQGKLIAVELELSEMDQFTISLFLSDSDRLMFDNYQHGTTEKPILIKYNKLQLEFIPLEDVFEEATIHLFKLNLAMEMRDKNLSY